MPEVKSRSKVSAAVAVKQRIAIVSSHPIQYNAPLFQFLSADDRLTVKVFYTWSQSEFGDSFDPEFKRKIKWDIDLLTGYEYEFVRNVSKSPGSHHFRGLINPGLLTKVKAWRPDLVIVYGWAFQSHLQLMIALHGKVKVGFRGDSHLLGRATGYKAKLKQLFLKWVYSHVDYAYYVGTNNRKYFEAAGVKGKRLVFAPHAVDNARFSVHQDLRKEYGIGNETVFLYAGKFMHIKNLYVLINAFRKLNRDNARLIIAGSGELEKQLKVIAYPDNRIIFTGFINQSAMPLLYKTADVFCLMSTSETWGLGVNEAMAAGCAAIVSSQVGCGIDLVHYGINGFAVKPDDTDGLIEAMRALVDDRKRLNEFKEASREIIKDWSMEVAYKKIADHAATIKVLK